MGSPFDLTCELAAGAGPLDLVGDVYLNLDGSAAGSASTPDHADLDITADIDVRVEADLDNWGSSDRPALMSKWNANSNQRSWIMWIQSGTLSFSWSEDGTIGNSFTRAATVPIPALSGRLAVRATLDVDNGASGFTVTFYTAATLDGPWTQLGDQIVDDSSGITSIFNSTAVVMVGNRTIIDPNVDVSTPLTGRVYVVEVRDGIDGTIVANPDFGAQTPGDTSFADSTAKTWTVNSPAEIVGYTWQPAVTVAGSNALLEASWLYGRDDDLDPHPPGVCTLRLRNDDRSFDPDHTGGPWFGELLPRVPVRLRSTWSALDLPGTVGATASTPDHASLNVTDLDVRVHLAMDDWTPGGFGVFLVSQYAATNIAWALAVSATGQLSLSYSTNGTATTTATGQVPGFADGSDHWVRATLDVDNGAAGRDVAFYTSDDGVTWTQLGTTITVAGAIALFDSTANLAVSDILPFAGQVRYVEVRDGIDGTIVANPDFMSVGPGSATFRDGTAKTWTVNSTASIAIDTTHVLDEFYGFVGDDGWTQELHPPAGADCVLRLVDLLAVLAGGYKLPDVFDHAILGRSPVTYWVLDSPTGAEAIGDRSGNGHDGIVNGAVTFGETPIAASHGSAARFDASATTFGRIEISRSPVLPNPLDCAVVATFKVDSIAATNFRTLFYQGNGNVDVTVVQVDVGLDGLAHYLRAVDGGGLLFEWPESVADGAGHILFGQSNGVAVDTAVLDNTTAAPFGGVANGVGIGGFTGIQPSDHWDGWIGAVALYDRDLFVAERQAILDGYGKLAGLRSDEHLSWALDRIGIPAEARNLDEGTVLMGPANTRGQDALQWIQDVVATEQGELFVDHRDGGRLRFVNRYSRFLEARSTTVQEVFSDDPAESNVVRVERGDLDLPPMNATDVVNQVTVTWRGGEEVVADTASAALFGPRPRHVDTQATTATQARSAGEWLVARRKDARSVVRGVGTDASAARLAFRAVRHLRIGDRVTNRIHPQQVGAAVDHTLFVEKASHQVTRGVHWHTGWRTSAVDTFTPWILGVSLLGETTFAG